MRPNPVSHIKTSLNILIISSSVVMLTGKLRIFSQVLSVGKHLQTPALFLGRQSCWNLTVICLLGYMGFQLPILQHYRLLQAHCLKNRHQWSNVTRIVLGLQRRVEDTQSQSDECKTTAQSDWKKYLWKWLLSSQFVT